MEKKWFDLQRFAGEAETDADGGDGSSTGDTGDTGNAGGQTASENTTNNTDAGEEGASSNTAGTILGNNTGAKPPANSQDGDREGDQGKVPGQVPESYDFKAIVPDGMEYDESSAKAFGDIAKSCGLTQEQASKVAGYGFQYMQKGVDAAMNTIAQRQQQWGEQARTQLGNQFDATVAKAATGIDALSAKIPGIREALNETGAGNRIEMIQLMAAVGELVGEDTGHDGRTGGQEKSIYPNTDFGLYK